VVHRNTVKFEVPISLAAALILYLLVNDHLFSNSMELLSRIDGIVLLLFFGGFLYYIYRTMKVAPDVPESPIKQFSTPVSMAMIIGGLLALIFGGRLVVNNAISLANQFGVSEKLIGLTILAAGTSLPELATSAVAAYRKNTDIAIGNVIGSNIFNILFILGITSVTQPIQYNTAMNFDLKVLGAATVLLMVFMFTLNTRKLDRWEALLMLGAYVAYTLVLIAID
jgi:cation:H+ antiporter